MNDLNIMSPRVIVPVQPVKKNVAVVGIIYLQTICLEEDFLCLFVVWVLSTEWVESTTASIAGFLGLGLAFNGFHGLRE
jgi:hypothetical protein